MPRKISPTAIPGILAVCLVWFALQPDASAISNFWYDFANADFRYLAPMETQLQVYAMYDDSCVQHFPTKEAPPPEVYGPLHVNAHDYRLLYGQWLEGK